MFDYFGVLISIILGLALTQRGLWSPTAFG